jgi:TonB family protein
MRRWLQTIAELAAAALLHLAVLAAVGFGPPESLTAPARTKEEDRRVRRVRLAGPGRAAESGRRAEEMPGFPVPVAADDAPEGRAVMLPALAPDQVRNAPDGERSTHQKTAAPLPRPDLAQTEPQLARGARRDPDWQLPGQRARPLQVFPSPMPGPRPGQPAAQRLPPSGGSTRDVKLSTRGHDAAPPLTSRAPGRASPAAPSQPERQPAAHAEAAPGPAAPTAFKSAGHEPKPTQTGGGGLPGPAPTRPEAPAPGWASRGSEGGVPAGAAPGGQNQAPDEQRPAQAVPQVLQAALAEPAPESSASPAAREEAPEDLAPLAASALDERARSSASAPEAGPAEVGPVAARAAEDERSAGPDREPAPPAQDVQAAPERAPAPEGEEAILAQRRVDQPRPGEPAPQYREQAERTADPFTTGPTEGPRVTGPPSPEEAPGADPLARQGATGPVSESAPRHPEARAAGESAPQPEAPPALDSAPVPVPVEAEDAAPVAAAVARADSPEPDAPTRPEPDVAPSAAAAAEEQPSPRTSPRAAEEPSPPDRRELPTVAEAPRSEEQGPHVPRPERNQEDRPAAEGLPGGADSQQAVLLAMAPPPAQSALEGAAVRLDLPGDERLDSAQRALASATELLELAAIEGGEVGARRAAEAAAALAAAEEALRGMEAPEVSRTGAPPQAGVVADVPEGGGLGDEPGSARLGGNGRLNALAQDRVDHVVSLVGPSIAKRAGRGGTGKVDFRVDEGGYVREVVIRRSTGAELLDREIESTLHLAEPFAATPGWISVVVRFEER